MSKRLVLITGTTSGLGLETTKQLAKLDVHLVLAARNGSLLKNKPKL
ncbi:hypothetical protein SANA_07900 [Gottschalkiaceae bacterium SANA]|nr:hypothetical protein SANA_07900 [Gottschalkiaceae bacterium SANA]